MVSARPNCGLYDRFSQKEAAELLGVVRHTIKRWEDSGCIRFQVRKAGRRKFTTGQQIIKCWEAVYAEPSNRR